MQKKIIALATITAAIITGIVSCKNDTPESTSVASTISKDSLIQRGGYLVSIAGCDDCHSPKKFGPRGPEVDMDLRFSGFPSNRPFPKFDSNVVKKGLAMFNEDLTSAAGPWGVSFAANLTSDETGLGNWTEGRFFKALREGKFKGLNANRSLLPPMPWQNLSKMTDEDLKAVFAFFKSIKPVKNIVPDTRQLVELK